MELTNIVYSSTLIFLLVLCSIIVIGFIGSQYKKLQYSPLNRKMEPGKGNFNTGSRAGNVDSTNDLALSGSGIKAPVIIKYYEDKSENEDRKKSGSVEKNSVRRGGLVKEQYSTINLTNYPRERNGKLIQFK